MLSFIKKIRRFKILNNKSYLLVICKTCPVLISTLGELSLVKRM